MKNVHYTVINFYYALISTGGYLLWAFYEILFDSSSKDDPATSTSTPTTETTSTSTPTTETTSETTSETTNVKTKKRAKKEKDPEQGENLSEISETIPQVQND